jgi:hypothetical protein
MFRMLLELCGEEIASLDGRLGALDDVYVDNECWRIRYLVIAGAGEPVLVSTGCVNEPPGHGRIQVELSRLQLEAGAGAWPLDAAASWIDRGRLCSARDLLGLRVEAEDGIAGRVADLLVDDREWIIDYLVLDAAEAGAVYRVLLPPDWVDAIDLEGRHVRVRRTREELRNSPRLDS